MQEIVHRERNREKDSGRKVRKKSGDLQKCCQELEEYYQSLLNNKKYNNNYKKNISTTIQGLMYTAAVCVVAIYYGKQQR